MLHREIFGLLRPQDWEEDPGVIACDKVLQQVENELSGTHPARLERKVWQELKILKNLSKLQVSLKLVMTKS